MGRSDQQGGGLKGEQMQGSHLKQVKVVLGNHLDSMEMCCVEGVSVLGELWHPST